MGDETMIFLIAVIALGIFHKQDKRYWVLAASASAIQLFAHLLFNGCGTVENRGVDGYITAIVRQATNDGPEVVWIFSHRKRCLDGSLPIYMIYIGYKRKSNKSEQEDTASI
jgi:hypothetical protein